MGIEPMMIDFAHLVVEEEIGKFVAVDASISVGNAIHQNTADIGVDDFAHKVYYAKKAVELQPHMIAEVRRIIKDHKTLLVCVKRAILQQIDAHLRKPYKEQ